MLFDKNGFYLIDDNYKTDYDFAVELLGSDFPMKMNTTAKKFYSLDEALKKGNLFPDLYNQYKDYTPYEIEAKTAREKALLEIQKLDFAINELNLYLDLNPNDGEAYSLFKEYVKKYLDKMNEYSHVYGPLTIDNTLDEYEWSSSIWPWEEGEI